MTRSDYFDLFDDAHEALEFEYQVLSVGDEFLPQCARDVKDGGPGHTPAPEYWEFLITEYERMQAEAQ